jgi:type I restriction enzyme S subunit
MRYPPLPISSFCSTGSGGTPSRSNLGDYYDGTIPWVKSGELREDVILDTEEKITELAIKESSAKLVPKGALLIAMYGATIGRIAELGVEGATNQAVCHIVPDERIADKRYLYYGLRFKVPELIAQGAGGAQPNINQQIIRDTQIPLPPLPEQKRIATILDKADSIRRKRQEAVLLTEELLRSVFLEMFGDPVENNNKWPLMLMGTAIKAIETGWSANSEDRPREKGERAVLKISSVTSGRFLPSECKVVDDSQIDRELLTPKRGDLLFSRANTRELVAATCLVELDAPELFLPDKLWKIIPDEKATCTEYLRYLLAHPRFREVLTKQATGTSGSMLNISQAKVRSVKMPVPPMKLQQQFASFVWRNYYIRNKLEAASQGSNTLFSSLLQHAFKGEL